MSRTRSEPISVSISQLGGERQVHYGIAANAVRKTEKQGDESSGAGLPRVCAGDPSF